MLLYQVVVRVVPLIFDFRKPILLRVPADCCTSYLTRDRSWKKIKIVKTKAELSAFFNTSLT